MDEDVEVVIVGAGLAGLACARHLAADGRTVALLEASDGVGGRVRTDEVDGFLVDRGFQILLTAYPELARQLDLAALDLRRFEPGAQVWTGAGFEAMADPLRRPGAAVSTVRARVGSLADKARIGLLRWRLVRTDPVDLLRRKDRTTAASLRDLGLSDDVVRSFFRPLLGGIQLDLDLQGSARMADVILRTLAVGDAAVPAGGMGAIPAQLAGGLPQGTVRLGCPVERIDATTAVLADGTRIAGRALVVATEGPSAARLLGDEVDDPGSRAASALWFAGDEPPVRGRSILLDGAGTGPAANVVVMSEVAPSYAPDGRALVVAACPAAEPEGFVPAVRTQLRGWFGPVVDGWEVVAHHRIAHAQPAAAVPFSPKRPVSLGGGRYVAGDHRDTPSIQGALFSGRRCGERVALDLAP